MAPAADSHDFPANASCCPPRQPWAPPAPANGQPEGHREDIPQPVRGIARPAQDPHHVVDVAYQGIMDYRPQPFAQNPAYVFPDAGHVQGVPAQGQPAPVNQDPFGHFPQHVGPGPLQAAVPHPFIQIPAPNLPRAENLRRLAIRYLDHPSALVRMVSTEEDPAGSFKTVIILETPSVP